MPLSLGKPVLLVIAIKIRAELSRQGFNLFSKYKFRLAGSSEEVVAGVKFGTSEDRLYIGLSALSL